MVRTEASTEGGQNRQAAAPTGKRPTIEMVAAHAGVSRQTVSNAANAPNRLRPETLNKVLGAIEEMGYRPSQAALSSHRCNPSPRVSLIAEQLRRHRWRPRPFVPFLV